jgi:hypothetical protein
MKFNYRFESILLPEEIASRIAKHINLSYAARWKAWLKVPECLPPNQPRGFWDVPYKPVPGRNYDGEIHDNHFEIESPPPYKSLLRSGWIEGNIMSGAQGSIIQVELEKNIWEGLQLVASMAGMLLLAILFFTPDFLHCRSELCVGFFWTGVFIAMAPLELVWEVKKETTQLKAFFAMVAAPSEPLGIDA